MARTDKAVLVYHNPRCSRAWQAPEPLRAERMQHEAVEYLRTPPDPAEVGFRQASLDDSGLPLGAPNQAMLQPSGLIERRIVLVDGRPAPGHQPGAVRELF